MIARVLSSSIDGDRVVVQVQYLDTTNPQAPREVGVSTFQFDQGYLNAQARADIIAAGKHIEERDRETDRLMRFLEPGTEFTV